VRSSVVGMEGTPVDVGLSADIFVLRGETFLTLKRGPGAEEECGLDVRDTSILRVWSDPTPEGHDTVHPTYVGWSDEGDVVLSHEHTAHRWTTPDDCVARWCHPDLEAHVPEHATWMRQVRRNIELVRDLLGASG
jgi:hypothetical protein